MVVEIDSSHGQSYCRHDHVARQRFRADFHPETRKFKSVFQGSTQPLVRGATEYLGNSNN